VNERRGEERVGMDGAAQMIINTQLVGNEEKRKEGERKEECEGF